MLLLLLLRANRVRDSFLSERTWSFPVGIRDGHGKLLDRLADGRRDFFAARIGETHVQHALVVMCCHGDGPVDRLKDVGLDQLALAEDADACAVAVQ